MNFSALRQPVFLQFLLHPLVRLPISNAQTKNAYFKATFVTATTTAEIIRTNISGLGSAQPQPKLQPQLRHRLQPQLRPQRILSFFRPLLLLHPLVRLCNSNAQTLKNAYLEATFVTATTTVEIIQTNISGYHGSVQTQTQRIPSFFPPLLLLHPLVPLRTLNAQTKDAYVEATFVTTTTTAEIIRTNLSVRQPVFLLPLPHPLVRLRNSNAKTKNAYL